ncbi:hypothetical protein HDG41_004664 [Paraburkholderia sp. JPY162]|uniref:Uncharacterized protein n=1 Tax=Paraburkholderia youngii TaxID=2782701 RepID=A0A7W8L9I3_9BURK|nr:hypothetical protein [Paraburkholderia youngii]
MRNPPTSLEKNMTRFKGSLHDFDHIGALRGFLPSGLSNACPHALKRACEPADMGRRRTNLKNCRLLDVGLHVRTASVSCPGRRGGSTSLYPLPRRLLAEISRETAGPHRRQVPVISGVISPDGSLSAILNMAIIRIRDEQAASEGDDSCGFHALRLRTQAPLRLDTSLLDGTGYRWHRSRRHATHR